MKEHESARAGLLESGKPFLRVFGGERPERPPFWFMRQAGRYLPEYREIRERAGNFMNLCLTPELATEITLQPLRRYGMDAAILFSDILVVPFALGQDVAFHENKGPVLSEIGNFIEFCNFDDAAFLHRLNPVFETVGNVSEKLDNDEALIGFAGAPWTVATYMIEGGTSRDFVKTKMMAFRRPDDFRRLIDLLVEATVSYLDSQIEAGVDAIQIFDSWAGVLSEDQFRRWVIAPAGEIFRRLNEKHPDVPIIAFPRNAGSLYVDFVKETGVHGVSLDTTVSIPWAAREIQPRCVIQGNLDPLALVAGGETLWREATHILSGFMNGPFVFNLGHGIVPQTPPEHVAELTKFIRAWSDG